MRVLCVWIGFIWNIEMSVCMCLKSLCMILFKWWNVCVWMRFIWYYWNERFMCLDWFLYEILKWVFVCVWRLFVWYSLNDGLYVSLCALYDIIEMRDLCVCIGFIWNNEMSVCMRLKAICMILFKWWPACVWMRFIWYYWNERFMCLDWFYMKY